MARDVRQDFSVSRPLYVQRFSPYASSKSCVQRHLKPKTGYLEQVEIDLEPRSDDGSIPEILSRWYNYLQDATTRGSKSIQYIHETQDMLRSRGFVDIEETIIRLPFNTWPTDPHGKDVGRWYSVGFTEGLEAMSLGPFTRVFEWPPGDVRRLCEDVKSAVLNKKFHVYNNLSVHSYSQRHLRSIQVSILTLTCLRHIITARRP